MISNIKYKFWEFLAMLGFWIPCDKHLPDRKRWDWVMISYYEPGLVYRYIPMIAEYSHNGGIWLTEEKDYEYFLNHVCRITHWRKIPKDKHLKIK